MVPLSAVHWMGTGSRSRSHLCGENSCHDKRETLRQRTLDREAEQAIKERGE